MSKLFFPVVIAFLAVSCQHTSPSSRQVASTNANQGIISDVDDTIRISHTGGGSDNLLKVFLTKETFVGLPELYRGTVSEGQTDQLNFVSAAPSEDAQGNKIEKKFYKILTGTIHSLLKKFNYPSNYTLDMAPEAFGKIKDRKVKLKKVIAYKVATAEARMVEGVKYSLYGDDTEADHMAYAELAKKRPEMINAIYIHKVRGGVSIPIGTLYYTSLEPALLEYSQGRVSKDVVMTISKILLDPNVEFEKVFPSFSVCPNSKTESNWIVDLAHKAKVSDSDILYAAAQVQANMLYYCGLRGEVQQMNSGH